MYDLAHEHRFQGLHEPGIWYPSHRSLGSEYQEYTRTRLAFDVREHAYDMESCHIQYSRPLRRTRAYHLCCNLHILTELFSDMGRKSRCGIFQTQAVEFAEGLVRDGRR